MITYAIAEEDHCRPVESFLHNLLPRAPLAYLKKLVKSGHLSVNGIPLDSPDTLLLLGDKLSLKESGKTKAFLSGQRPSLDILYEDSWIVAFNKAPGLPMHRAAEVGERNLVELGSKFLMERDGYAGKLRPVNRLDRGTSGVVVLAKSPTAAGMFGRVVKEEGLAKVYLAIVQGRLPEKGRIAIPLEGKESLTSFRVLHQGERDAFASVFPITGRMHQIRQHFRAIGHPVAGDKRYGGKSLACYAGFLLHSFRTSLPHPATGLPLTIFAPLPAGYLNSIREITGDAMPQILKLLPDIPADSNGDES